MKLFAGKRISIAGGDRRMTVQAGLRAVAL
jgi:hypothetical protein